MMPAQNGELGEYARGLYNSVDGGTTQRLLGILAEVPRVRTDLLPPLLGVDAAEVEHAKTTLMETGAVTEGEDETGPYLSVQPALADCLVELAGPNRGNTTAVRRAHALAEADETPATSVALLLELGELEEAQRSALAHFSAVLEQRDQTLRALRGLSLEQLESYPTLLMCRLILERPDGTIPITTVESMARGLHVSLGAQRRALGDFEYSRRLPMQIATERMLGLWDSAMQLSAQLLRFTKQSEGYPLVGVEKLSPIALAVVALTGILSGDFALADEATESGYRLALFQENTLEQVHALSLAALILALRGRVVEAEAKLELAEALSRGAALNPPEFSWVDGVLARALVACHRGDGEDARAALDKLSADMDRMEQWPIVVLVESMVARTLVGSDEALVILRRRRNNVPEGRAISPAWQCILQARHADLATFAGRYAEAQRVLGNADKSVDDSSGCRYPLMLSQVRLLLFRGRYLEVVEKVASLEDGEIPLSSWEGLQSCVAAAN